VWVPVVVAFAFMGEWWKVVFLSVWGALIVGSIDNVVRPFVVSASTKLHPLLMALAALGGTYAFGILGILLGPLIVAVAGALMAEIEAELQTARASEEVPG
jgi:predicted PurR-regulated permease PerM